MTRQAAASTIDSISQDVPGDAPSPTGIGAGRRVLLLAGYAVLMSAAYAPFGQFYLAWAALVPWLVSIRDARTLRAAFFWGWLGGAGFYALSLSWLWRATIPGTIGLACYLSLFHGLAASIMRSTGLLDPRRTAAVMQVILIAVVWAGVEWMRGFALGGFPWIFISQTQTSLPAMCQVADITGSYGVSFWIMSINALGFAAFVHRDRRDVLPAAATVAAILGAVLGYGVFRLGQSSTSPGPRIMVVQPNHPHERGGRRTVTQEQQLEFHLITTRQALKEASAKPVDLVVWSETVMPGLNPEARNEPGLAAAPFLRQVYRQLSELSADHGVALLTGAYYVGGWQGTIGSRRATDIRNSAFLFDREGKLSASRYDKVHLVPFAEFLPFRESAPAIYAILRWFAAYSVDYPIIAGDGRALTVFTLDGRGGLPGVRFVTPICFEDTDAALIARMFRPGADGRKRADLIVNITNDGWFRGVQQAQHLQGAILRSIENRVPTARADNTGISGFIDSTGRLHEMLPVRSSGVSTFQVSLDNRLTFYTRFGDVFGVGCAIIPLLMLAARPLISRRRREV